jgi:hypothetical protein
MVVVESQFHFSANLGADGRHVRRTKLSCMEHVVDGSWQGWQLFNTSEACLYNLLLVADFNGDIDKYKKGSCGLKRAEETAYRFDVECGEYG